MLAYIVRRLLLAVLTVWAISVLSFIIIHLPPGDYVTSYIASMSASGSAVSEGEAKALREQLGLDKPITVQYLKWTGLMLQGNFGMAMEWGRPVSDVIGDRLTLTMVISVAAIIFTWALALPIGIFSAVYRYSFMDYVFTLVGFIGLAIPGFLLALIVMYVGFAYFDANVGGLFSPDFVSGSIIVSLVLSLPTVGPLLLKALIAQDMFLAGTIVLLLGVLTVIGTFISDLLLMWIDPRIRRGRQ